MAGRSRALELWAEKHGEPVSAFTEVFVTAFVAASGIDATLADLVGADLRVRVSTDEVEVDLQSIGAPQRYRFDGSTGQLNRSLRFAGYEFGQACRDGRAVFDPSRPRPAWPDRLALVCAVVLVGIALVAAVIAVPSVRAVHDSCGTRQFSLVEGVASWYVFLLLPVCIIATIGCFAGRRIFWKAGAVFAIGAVVCGAGWWLVWSHVVVDNCS